MKKVILTVGLPRSGKSTWSNEQGYPIVNKDSIRLAIHGEAFLPKVENLVSYIEEKMIESLFNAGHDVIIIDATHLKQKYIERWYKDYDVELKFFYTPIKECKKRAKETRKEYLIPVIDRMLNQTDIYEIKEYYDNKETK